MTDLLFFAFVTGFLIQSFYFLMVFLRLIFYREQDHVAGIKGVSVVVAAHNEKKNLERLIPLLLSQNHPDYEIILADDRSSDGSADLISSFNHKNLKIVKIEATPPEYNPKKYALTKAIERAEKEIILLTDADCYPLSSSWISTMQSGFTEGKEIVLGYSPYEKKEGFLNLFIRYETFYTGIQYLSFALLEMGYMGVGRNLAYLRALFIKNKGFEDHKSITGGDDDLFIGKVAGNKNIRLRIKREAQVISVPKTTYPSFIRQKIRHLSVGSKYSPLNRLKTGLLPLSQFILYFSFIFLVFSNTYIYLILSIFILRTLLLIVIFALISRKLGETFKWLWFPVLDLSYLVNYTITGIAVVFSKNIKWT